MDEDSLNSFCEISGADTDRAKFFLESAGGNLEVALASFFENSGEEFVDSLPPPDNFDHLEDFSESVREEGTSVDFDTPPEHLVAEDMSKKIATLFDAKKSGNGSSDDEDDRNKGQAFYVGGSEKSGQEILGPPRDEPNDLIRKVFRGAKDHGAEEVRPEDREPSTKPKSFGGGGYRLGDTETEAAIVVPPSSSEPQGATGGQPEQLIPVKMWKDGFSIGDGELRDYKDIKAQMFLTSIMAGEIPSELLRQFPHQKIAVDIENHEGEEYKPPPMKPFSGQGQTLGGILPEVIGAGTSSSAGASTEPEKTFGRAPIEIPEVDVDSSQPTTTLQIRLADGSRLAIKFNNSHRISDIRDVILRARPDYSDRVFVIMTTYPKKEFEDETQTLEEAGILGAVVVQRLK